MNILGGRIKSLREGSNIQQKMLAKAISVSNVVLSRYESGERKPDYDTLKLIANYFDVTTDYLLGNSDHPQMSDDDKKAALIEEMARKYPEAEIMFDNLSGMTVEQLKEVDDFIRFKLQKRSD